MKEKKEKIFIIGLGVTGLMIVGVIAKSYYKTWCKIDLNTSNAKSQPESPSSASSKTSDFHYTNTQHVNNINVTNNSVSVHVAPSDNVVQEQELNILKKELCEANDRIKKLEDSKKLLEERLSQLEYKEQELVDKTIQRFVNLTQYTLAAHLENAASIAANKAEKGQDEATLRTYYYAEAIKDAEKLAVEMDIQELADSYAQQRIDMLGSNSLEYDSDVL